MNSIAPIGFQDATNIYDQAQPSYLDEVIQFLKSWYATPTTIVDIGAGTGKLTRLLTNFKLLLKSQLHQCVNNRNRFHWLAQSLMVMRKIFLSKTTLLILFFVIHHFTGLQMNRLWVKLIEFWNQMICLYLYAMYIWSPEKLELSNT